MGTELHPVVQLLLARMKSHPEEFQAGMNRWGWMVNDVMDHCSKEEAEAIKEGLRPIRLQEIHEHMMDELCNGDERRAKESRIRREAEERQMQSYVQQQRAYLQQAVRPGSFVELNNVDWGRRNNFPNNNTGLVATMKKALGI